jgi:hypothetical protein
MPWFGVKVVTRATHGDSPPSEDLYEESVILVVADDDERAAERARELAQETLCSYENVYGELVTWQLDRVYCPVEIENAELADGLEVYSRFYYLRDGREVSPREMPD